MGDSSALPRPAAAARPAARATIVGVLVRGVASERVRLHRLAAVQRVGRVGLTSPRLVARSRRGRGSIVRGKDVDAPPTSARPRRSALRGLAVHRHRHAPVGLSALGRRSLSGRARRAGPRSRAAGGRSGDASPDQRPSTSTSRIPDTAGSRDRFESRAPARVARCLWSSPSSDTRSARGVEFANDSLCSADGSARADARSTASWFFSRKVGDISEGRRRRSQIEPTRNPMTKEIVAFSELL